MMIATWKSKVYNNIIESQRKSKSNKSVKCVNGDMSMGTCFFDKHPKYQKEISC